MKKLLLAPFLLASLFSFGGELKANSNSRYELLDPKSSLSESQSDSKDVWYLLNQSVIEEKGWYKIKKWRPKSFEKLKITTVSDRTICERLASKEKRWIEQIDLGSYNFDDDGTIKVTDYRYRAYTKCISGRKEDEANYFLTIASNLMDTNRNIPYINQGTSTDAFDTLYFKDLSKCNLAKSKLDNWFTSLENKFLSKSNLFLRSSTKCFRKT